MPATIAQLWPDGSASVPPLTSSSPAAADPGCDGVLRYDERLAAQIDAGRPLSFGAQEREIRACALHACELIAARAGVSAHELDNWLWNRGQAPAYKERPRHRCRTVFY